MNDTAALADELGVDYHATLLAALEQFNSEFDARLREMKAKGQSATTAGIESIPAPVSNAVSPSTPPKPATASSNGLQKDPA